MEDALNLELLTNVIGITKEIRNILLPFAAIFFFIAIIKDIYDYFLGGEPVDLEEDSLLVLAGKAFRKNILSFVLFVSFPLIALFPVTLMHEVIKTFRAVDPVSGFYDRKLNLLEDKLRDQGYLNDDNIAYWEGASLSNKVAFVNAVKVRESITRITLTPEEQEDYGEKALKNLLAGKKIGAPKNFSIMDFFSSGDYSNTLTLIFVTVAELVRRAFEFILGKLFAFLLYLDYLIGIFAAFMAIFPWTRGNFVHWLIENFSLLSWALIFILIKWLLSLIAITTVSTQSVDISSIAMPILTVVIYTGVASYAAKIVGRENGAMPLGMAARSAMTAIPVLGGAMITTVQGLGSSKFGQAGGGLLKRMGAKAVDATVGRTAAKGITDAYDYFKPQPKISSTEQLNTSVQSLVQKLS